MTTFDFAHIHSAKPCRIVYPETEEELINLVIQSRDKISIAGAKFSHGGHTMLDDLTYIDTKHLNKIIKITPTSVTVQGGARWWQVQQVLDKYDLSVAEMQSYNDFSVGGSISVNCHGRGVIYSSISDTILSLKVLTESGVFICSKDERLELFKATIGGYGMMGIILEATLIVEPNFTIEKRVFKSLTNNLTLFNPNKVWSNLVFYNGVIYPTNEKEIYHVCWFKSNKRKTITQRLQKREEWYPKNMILEQLLRRTNLFKRIRSQFEPNLDEIVCNKNYEMSYTTNALKPLVKFPTTTILQEYFVRPCDLVKFLNTMNNTFKRYTVNVLNISLRWVSKITYSILNYAPQDCISIVLYINVVRYNVIKTNKEWTQILIDNASAYYLPYLPFASIQQFRRVYPQYKEFMKIRNMYNPTNRFSNQFAAFYFT